MRSLMMCCWIWLVPSKIVVSRASRQCRSTWRSVVYPLPPWSWIPSPVTLHRHLGGDELDHRRLLLACLALIETVGDLLVEGPGLLDARGHQRSLKRSAWKSESGWSNCSRACR
jgi:hypothetical protein